MRDELRAFELQDEGDELEGIGLVDDDEYEQEDQGSCRGDWDQGRQSEDNPHWVLQLTPNRFVVRVDMVSQEAPDAVGAIAFFLRIVCGVEADSHLPHDLRLQVGPHLVDGPVLAALDHARHLRVIRQILHYPGDRVHDHLDALVDLALQPHLHELSELLRGPLHSGRLLGREVRALAGRRLGLRPDPLSVLLGNELHVHAPHSTHSAHSVAPRVHGIVRHITRDANRPDGRSLRGVDCIFESLHRSDPRVGRRRQAIEL
mmetsp:Transcript_97076/g.280170  ORF Transcript_97076/g.280170 Transcript_97076/m.280170 type:complete len:260 (-) Transcript_97076:27-806(-)